MRVVAFLLALYFVVLGCLSCTDAPACPTPPGMATLKAGHPADEPGATDWCSPLCQCQCCAGVALPQPLLRLSFRERPLRRYVARRYAVRPRQAMPTRAPVAPWQPPQRA